MSLQRERTCQFATNNYVLIPRRIPFLLEEFALHLFIPPTKLRLYDASVAPHV